MSELLPKSAAVDAAVESLLTVIRLYRRGDVVPWEVLEKAAGYHRREGHGPAAFDRARKAMLKEGINLSAQPNIGLKLEYAAETVSEVPRRRGRKVISQAKKIVREVGSVPDSELTEHQRAMKNRTLQAAKATKRETREKMKTLEVVACPTPSLPKRPRPSVDKSV